MTSQNLRSFKTPEKKTKTTNHSNSSSDAKKKKNNIENERQEFSNTVKESKITLNGTGRKGKGKSVRAVKMSKEGGKANESKRKSSKRKSAKRKSSMRKSFRKSAVKKKKYLELSGKRVEMQRTLDDRFLYRQYAEKFCGSDRSMLAFYHDVSKFKKRDFSDGRYSVEKYVEVIYLKKYKLNDECVFTVNDPIFDEVVERMRIDFERQNVDQDFFDELFSLVEGAVLKLYLRMQRKSWKESGVSSEGHDEGNNEPVLALPVIMGDNHQDDVTDAKLEAAMETAELDFLQNSVKKQSRNEGPSRSRRRTLLNLSSDDIMMRLLLGSPDYEERKFFKYKLDVINHRLVPEMYPNNDVDEILFEMETEISDENLVFENISEAGSISELIVGISIAKLVNLLTSFEYYDETLLDEFLFTFPLFISYEYFVQLLYMRWNLPTPSTMDIDTFKSQKHTGIKNSIVFLIKRLLEKFSYYMDIPSFGAHIERFLEEVMKEDEEFLPMAEHLLRILDPSSISSRLDRLGTKDQYAKKSRTDEFLKERVKKMNTISKAKSVTKKTRMHRFSTSGFRNTRFSSGNHPTGFLRDESEGTKHVNITKEEVLTQSLLDFHPDVISEQLCLIDAEHFMRIKPFELLDTKWSSKNKGEEAPNVLGYIDHFNNISDVISNEILKQENIKKRANVLNRCIHIAERCRILKNFNSVMMILASVQHSGVYRLKQTWKLLPLESIEIYAELDRLMSANAGEGNFYFYRRTIKAAFPPFIPYLGISLTDLTFANESSDYLDEDNKILNWHKYSGTAKILQEIKLGTMKYPFHADKDIQSFLRRKSQTTDDEKYDLSLLLEPRGWESKKTKRIQTNF